MMKFFMKHGVYIILLFLNFSLVYAQANPDYIQEYTHRFDITAYAGWDIIEANENDIDYKPNNPVKLGLNFSINNSLLSFGGSVNITDRANPDLPKSSSFDFQLHSYSRRFMIDLYLQNFKGFYSGELPDIISYPDMNIMKIGAEAAYIFNNSRFSARAAFAQTERQLKSAGSFILGAGSYFFRLERDPMDLRYLQLGANLGYAHTFVITRNIFVSAAMTGGVYYSNQLSSEELQDNSASFSGVGRASAGYNTNNWCLSLLVIYKIHYFNSDLRFNTGSFQMAYVYRFNNFFKRGAKS